MSQPAIQLLSTHPVQTFKNNKISCPKHINYVITNICIHQNCVEPLCPNCIEEHLKVHKLNGQQPHIMSIEVVRDQYMEIVSSHLKQLKNDHSQIRLKQQYNQYASQHSILDIASQNLHNLVDQFIGDLRIQSQKHIINVPNENNQDIDKEIKKYTLLQHDLSTSDEYITAVVYCLERQVGKVPEKDSNSDPSISTEIYINEAVIKDIMALLHKYVVLNVSKKEVSKGVSFKDITELRPTRQFRNQTQHKQKPIKVTFIRPHHQRIDSLGPYNCTFICTLIDDQKQALVYDFEKRHIETLTFDIDNRLPHNHGCVQVDSQVYIMGGLVKDFDRFNAVSSVYSVKLQTLRVQLIGNMNNRRQNFGCCVLDQSIYVAGGSLNDDECSATNFCERMDTSTKNWSSIAACKYKTTGSCLIAFKINLIKLGGLDCEFSEVRGVEIYNTQKDEWSILRATDNIGYEWEEGRVKWGGGQINDNEILIFGGTMNDEFHDESWIGTVTFGKDVDGIKFKKTHSVAIACEVKGPTIVNRGNLYSFIVRNDNQIIRKPALVQLTYEGWNFIG